MINLVSLVGLFCFTMILAIGQFLFKLSATSLVGLDARESLLMLARSPSFYIALALYGGSTLLWVWILTRVPLSVAYPFVALVMILVPVIGWQFFGERLSPAYWCGAALIVSGILVMQLAG